MSTLSASSSITTLVFDWGDTLMCTAPGRNSPPGPMASWKEVAAVEGAAQTLEQLAGRYLCVVATNASDSRSREVRQALARVGLDSYFKVIFTSSELGFRKPDPRFFQTIRSVLGREREQILMIGDDFRADILGAAQAGWHTLWFNPTGKTAPGLLPSQDAEITRLVDMPALLERPFVASYNLCLSWLQEQNLTQNLLAHVHAVASAAYLLAVWLRASGQPVDPLLAHRGALLHDLAKLKALERSPEQRISHAELAALILKDRAEPQLAEIARRHPLFALIQPEAAPRTWEEKLVYFTDKLVETSRLAGLEERIASLRQRYPSDSEKIASMIPALLTLQQELCTALALPSEELIPRIRSAFYSA